MASSWILNLWLIAFNAFQETAHERGLLPPPTFHAHVTSAFALFANMYFPELEIPCEIWLRHSPHGEDDKKVVLPPFGAAPDPELRLTLRS